MCRGTNLPTLNFWLAPWGPGMILELELHGRRTAWLTARLCGVLDVARHHARDWTAAALTHDIGKLDVPLELLVRPAALTGEERFIVERHCIAGAKRLVRSAGPDAVDTTTAAVAVALSHHEWWNGAGYPFGLIGSAIPQCARIVAVADVVDALTSVRSYKPAWSLEAALDEIAAQRGLQFDPDCVDAMQAVARTLPQDWRAVAEAWASQPPVGHARPCGAAGVHARGRRDAHTL
jgi:HD-GYP domain-containing protein (c-di-GMP phosphodiesterase class II)